MEPETESNYLSKLKQAIEKGQAKRYGTFVLVIMACVFFANVATEGALGEAIAPTTEKTCAEIKGVCSDTPCEEGYSEKDNFCPNNEFCCKKA